MARMENHPVTARTLARPPAIPVETPNPFAFVHINKCGGSSVEIALGLQKMHKTASELRDHMGSEEWARRFTFSIVRNPFARVTSIYFYRVRTGHGAVARRLLNLNEWIEKVWHDRDETHVGTPILVAPASDWLVEDDQLLVSDVAKLETLQDDWPRICQGMGRRIDLSRTNANLYPPYQQLLTPRSRAIIEEAFAEDLERFGYTY